MNENLYAIRASHQAFLACVAKLSWPEKRPQLARQFLAEKGIALFVLPALPQTRLDPDGAPIIGITIRHYRLDASWFTLLA